MSICAVDRDDDGGETLRPRHALLRYDERTVGIGRYYKGKQENAEITRLVRVPRHADISSQDVALLGGEQYHIRQVQYPKDVTPPCCDLSLERVTHDYDLKAV